MKTPQTLEAEWCSSFSTKPTTPAGSVVVKTQKIKEENLRGIYILHVRCANFDGQQVLNNQISEYIQGV